MGDIANNLGNYRLVVLPVNRRKLAQWPDATTDFTGKEDPAIASSYTDALSNFNRDNYLAFVSSRMILVQGKVMAFLGLRMVSKVEG
jgi:hypothetical protein